MLRPLAISTILTVALLWAGYTVGALTTKKSARTDLSRLVAVGWSDSRFKAGPYGAYVYYEPAKGYNNLVLYVYSAAAPLKLRYHWVIAYAIIPSHEQAVSRFGEMEWREDGLHIGSKAGLAGNIGPEHAYVPIWEIEQKEPNKAPEPTPRPVTIRAEPRIAPVRSVAHL